MTEDAALAARIERHIRRLVERVRHEAALDGSIPRRPWGSLMRDTPEGRRVIAAALAHGEYALAGRPR